MYSHHLQQLLETCSHLVSFKARWRQIHGHDMLAHPETDPTCFFPHYHNSVTGARAVRPWACEATLQELVIGFMCSQLSARQNETVYAQLGRLRVLERLELCMGSVVPTLECGMGHMRGMVALREFEMRYWCWPMPEKLRWMRVHASRSRIYVKKCFLGWTHSNRRGHICSKKLKKA